MVPLHSTVTEINAILGTANVSLAISTDHSSPLHIRTTRKHVGQTETFFQAPIQDEHPDHSAILDDIEFAKTFANDGQAETAIWQLEKAVSQQEGLPKEDQNRLVLQHKLGKAYLHNGRVLDAVEILEKVVEIRGKVLVETHADYLASQHELAIAYIQNGQATEAIRLLKAVVLTEREILNESHVGRLTSEHELARAYLADGQASMAIEILEQVVRVKAATLNESDPHLLASQVVLAEAYLRLDRVSDAVTLLERVVPIADATFSEHNKFRIDTQKWLDFARTARCDCPAPESAGNNSTCSSSSRHVQNNIQNNIEFRWPMRVDHQSFGLRDPWNSGSSSSTHQRRSRRDNNLRLRPK